MCEGLSGVGLGGGERRGSGADFRLFAPDRCNCGCVVLQKEFAVHVLCVCQSFPGCTNFMNMSSLYDNYCVNDFLAAS